MTTQIVPILNNMTFNSTIDIYLQVFAILVFLALFLFLLWLPFLQNRLYIYLKYKEVAVIGERATNRVSRLLPEGFHWIHPFREKMETIIRLDFQTNKTELTAICKDGSQVDVIAILDFKPNIDALSDELRDDMAPNLAEKSLLRLITRKRLDQAIRKKLLLFTAEELHDANCYQDLIRHVTAELKIRLPKIGIQPLEVIFETITPEKSMAEIVQEKTRVKFLADFIQEKGLSKDEINNLLEIASLDTQQRHGFPASTVGIASGIGRLREHPPHKSPPLTTPPSDSARPLSRH